MVEPETKQAIEDSYYYQLYDSLYQTGCFIVNSLIERIIKSRQDTSITVEITDQEIVIYDVVLSDSVWLDEINNLIAHTLHSIMDLHVYSSKLTAFLISAQGLLMNFLWTSSFQAGKIIRVYLSAVI